MSIQDQALLLKSIHPFDLLSEKQLQKALNAMDIAYYPKNTTLISPTILPKHLFIIAKGEVGEYHENELIKIFQHPSAFDADVLIYDKTENSFTVLEELICFELKKKDFLELFDENKEFKEYFLTDFANRLQLAKQSENKNLSSFILTKISDTYLHKPCIVKPSVSIMEALAKMEDIDGNCIIVDDEDKKSFGIVTDSVLRKNILYENYDKHSPIGPIALRPIISIDKDDFLFNALLELTKHSIKRIVVTSEDKIVGILEQLDILSSFANHSYLVTIQIRKAKTLQELKVASKELVQTIKKLQEKGTKIEYIAQLVSELNIHIYKKLYDLIFPEHLKNGAAFLVMGSEGRKEQILKTDQDNALIIKDSENIDEYREYANKITQTLLDFGFPKCEGNIMVSNPYWCKHKIEFEKELDRWLESPNFDDFMNLAIFFDAICVAGDKNLLKDIKDSLFSKNKNKDVFLANFSKMTLAFETPINIFSSLKTHKNLLDLKKGGIFPIVHGVRSLALEFKIEQTNTIDRIKVLEKLDIFDKSFGDGLIEAYDTILSLRLKEQLYLLENNLEYKDSIRINSLNQLESELLKDSFKIVDKFKKYISHHFRIDMIR